MTTRIKQIAKLLIRVLITVGLLVWVFSQIDFGQFRQAVKTARWQLLIALWAVTVVIFWINAIKIQLILKNHR